MQRFAKGHHSTKYERKISPLPLSHKTNFKLDEVMSRGRNIHVLVSHVHHGIFHTHHSQDSPSGNKIARKGRSCSGVSPVQKFEVICDFENRVVSSYPYIIARQTGLE